jgi:hypothetical protein
MKFSIADVAVSVSVLLLLLHSIDFTILSPPDPSPTDALSAPDPLSSGALSHRVPYHLRRAIFSSALSRRAEERKVCVFGCRPSSLLQTDDFIQSAHLVSWSPHDQAGQMVHSGQLCGMVSSQDDPCVGLSCVIVA